MVRKEIAAAYRTGKIGRAEFVLLWGGNGMGKINDGIFVTETGMVLSGEKRQQLANLLQIKPGTTPITIEREHVAKVLRNENGSKCFCAHGEVGVGETISDFWLSQEAAMIVSDCDQFMKLYEWVVGS